MERPATPPKSESNTAATPPNQLRGGTPAIAARQNIAGTSPFEPIIGFSRAVRIGNTVHVAGTGPVGAEDMDAAAQTRHTLEIIRTALEKAGARMEDVVRTRMFLTRVEDWETVGRAHGEYFATIRPAATMVVVAQLLNPKWLVEIEADAVIVDSQESGPPSHA
jgi:enamine deaminase RidA (YjgF/YER057c/UK114 family)